MGDSPRIHAIILAGGTGDRFGYETPKQFIKIGGKTVLEHTLDVFEKNELINNIIIVVHPNYRFTVEDMIIKKANVSKVSKILNGGKTRRESSFIGIMSIENDEDFVLIHDAVRPFLSDRIIIECIRALNTYDAVDVAIPADDTIIKINEENLIEDIPIRRFLMRGQTPQGFKVGLIRKAHLMALNDSDIDVTDDCGLIIKYNLAKVYVIEGDRFNIKLTFPEDIYLADRIFQLRHYSVTENLELPANSFKDKVILVFGASRGIGKSIVEKAKILNAKIYGFSRANGIDITEYDKVYEVMRSVYDIEGKIDYVINTAAILKMGSLLSRKIDDISYEIAVNYLGAVNICKAAIPFLEKSKGSILLFTSSSYTRGRALYSIYSSTKAAVVNFVQAMAEELANHGIRINALNPERTATPMRFENFGKEPEDTLLDPDFVAEVALKVLSLSFTGQVVDVRRREVSNNKPC